MHRIALIALALLLLLPVAAPATNPEPPGVTLPADTAHLVDPRLALMVAEPARMAALGAAPAPAGYIRVVAQVDELTPAQTLEIQSLGGTVLATFPAIDGLSVRVPLTALPSLTRLDGLVWLEPDLMYYPLLDESVPAIGVTQVWQDYGIAGEGMTIAVLDTGIDASHESLDDLDDDPATNDTKVIGFYNADDAVQAEEEPHDTQGHGSHVAGIAAGTGGPAGTYRGVAPGAYLVGVIALNNGGGTVTEINRAIQWTIDNRERFSIDVMTLSLGAPLIVPVVGNTGGSSMSQLVDAAVDAGIVATVAVGNGNFPGCIANPNSVSNPADSRRAITVGWADNDGDRHPCSSKGPTGDGRIKPDVMAPGSGITSVDDGSGDGYTPMSGSSMATPHVAGLAALMLQANPDLVPNATVNPVKQILHETSDHRISSLEDCGELYSPNNCYGWGFVDSVGAVQRAIDLRSGSLAGLVSLQALDTATYTVDFDYTRTEFTNRGADGGTPEDYWDGDLPEEVVLETRLDAAWPLPTDLAGDAGEASGISATVELDPVSQQAGKWLLRGWFNYTGSVDPGELARSLPRLSFTLTAPNSETTAILKASYRLNGMPGRERSLTVETYTEPPDVALTSLTLDPAAPEAGEATELVALLTNQGLGRATTVEVEFRNGTQLLDRRTFSLAAGESLALRQPWNATAGTHTLAAEVVAVTPTDADGSNQLQTLIVNVAEPGWNDTEPPTVSIDFPAPEAEVAGVVTVRGSASDNFRIERVEVRNGTAQWQLATGTASWEWEWNTTRDYDGRYRLEARAYDGNAYSAVVAVEVEVANGEGNARPTPRLTAEPAQAYTDVRIVFSGNTSRDDSAVARYAFDFGDGVGTGWVDQSWVGHAYATPGSYTATLVVEDDEGVRSAIPATVTVTVSKRPANTPPVAVMALPRSGSTTNPVMFSAAGSYDPDDETLTYRWESDRDSLLGQDEAVIAVLSPGNHLITLTVTDPWGESASVSREITVSEPEPGVETDVAGVGLVVAAAMLMAAARRRRW